MLNKRVQALNGRGKMTLADMAKRVSEPQAESEFAKITVDRLQDLTAEKAARQAWDEAQIKIKELEEKLESASEERESEAGLFEEIKAQLTSQNTELKTSIATLTDEIKAIKDAEVGKELEHGMAIGVQKGLIRDLEIKLSDALARFDQASKQIYELKESAKQIPMPLVVEKPIPSFKFKPVKDVNGNIVEVVATPIGG